MHLRRGVQRHHRYLQLFSYQLNRRHRLVRPRQAPSWIYIKLLSGHIQPFGSVCSTKGRTISRTSACSKSSSCWVEMTMMWRELVCHFYKEDSLGFLSQALNL